jgi:5-methylcytosine-specific restriction protein A
MMSLYRELKGKIGKDIFEVESIDPTLLFDVGDPTEIVKLQELTQRVKSIPEIEKILADYEKSFSTVPPKKVPRMAGMLARNPVIADYVKKLAGHRCYFCKVGGFIKRDGTRYAEAHHKKELGQGGQDLPSNLICVCPTCHKKLHYAKDFLNDVEVA